MNKFVWPKDAQRCIRRGRGGLALLKLPTGENFSFLNGHTIDLLAFAIHRPRKITLLVNFLAKFGTMRQGRLILSKRDFAKMLWCSRYIGSKLSWTRNCSFITCSASSIILGIIDILANIGFQRLILLMHFYPYFRVITRFLVHYKMFSNGVISQKKLFVMLSTDFNEIDLFVVQTMRKICAKFRSILEEKAFVLVSKDFRVIL